MYTCHPSVNSPINKKILGVFSVVKFFPRFLFQFSHGVGNVDKNDGNFCEIVSFPGIFHVKRKLISQLPYFSENLPNLILKR